MEHWHGWETLPFHFIYVGVAIAYGVRSWRMRPTLWTLAAIALATGYLTIRAGDRGTEAWAELAEVPMMCLLFLAMVFHVEGRRRAVELSERLSQERAERIEREWRFFSRASHELLTPITVIRGHMDLLGRGEAATPEDVARTRAIVTEELQRSESLVSELLVIAKLASGAMERETIDVAELVRGAAGRWIGIGERDWRLRIEATGTMEGAPNMLGRALEALIENAYRHTPPGRRIAVLAETRGDMVVLAVDDQGCGIPEEEVPRVFDRFYRVSDRPSGGAGLGLSIVRAVAESHGGRVEITSAEGRGTRVEMILPRRLPQSQPAALETRVA
jgi:signal transduction histidine kinase